jgi:hypothetical protein
LKGTAQVENSVKKLVVLLRKRIAKRGKPFVDGSFIKECLQCGVDPAREQTDTTVR